MSNPRPSDGISSIRDGSNSLTTYQTAPLSARTRAHDRCSCAPCPLPARPRLEPPPPLFISPDRWRRCCARDEWLLDIPLEQPAPKERLVVRFAPSVIGSHPGSPLPRGIGATLPPANSRRKTETRSQAPTPPGEARKTISFWLPTPDSGSFSIASAKRTGYPPRPRARTNGRSTPWRVDPGTSLRSRCRPKSAAREAPRSRARTSEGRAMGLRSPIGSGGQRPGPALRSRGLERRHPQPPGGRCCWSRRAYQGGGGGGGKGGASLGVASGASRIRDEGRARRRHPYDFRPPRSFLVMAAQAGLGETRCGASARRVSGGSGPSSLDRPVLVLLIARS